MSGNYDRIARFYDVDMARNMAFDDVGFYAGICRRRGGRVLELGCGTGRILLSLLGANMDAVGVDASSGMLQELRERAKARSLPAPVAKMDVRALAVRPVFDVILCPYSLVTYLTTEDDLARAFAEVRAALRPGGLVVVDAFIPRPVTEHTDFRLDYRRPFGALTLARSKRITRLDDKRNRIERRYQVFSDGGDLLEQIDVSEEIRPFQPDELIERMEAARFVVDERWWDYQTTDPAAAASAQFFTAVARCDMRK